MVIPNYVIATARQFTQSGGSRCTRLTKVSLVVGCTASPYTFPPAMDFARSAVEFPTSSLMFVAAWSSDCEPGLPET